MLPRTLIPAVAIVLAALGAFGCQRRNAATREQRVDLLASIDRAERRPQGAVFTLKMNDWAFLDELPALEQRIRMMGFRQVMLRHLPSNRREVCAVARR